MAPYLRKVVERDFAPSTSSDFTIRCGQKTFHVHSVVLEQIQYFDRLFSGAWKETQECELNLTEWDAATVSALLSYVYGKPYPQCARDARQPLETPMKVLLDLIAKSAKPQSLTPGTIIQSSVLDPHQQLASLYCSQLSYHAKVCAIADRYLVNDLADEAYSDFVAILSRCWDSADILQVIRYVYASVPAERIGLKLRELLCPEIVPRIHMMEGAMKYVDTLMKVPALAVDMLSEIMKHPPSVPPAGSTIRYCAHNSCRQNRTVHKTATKEYCDSCDNSWTLTAVRTRLWNDAEYPKSQTTIDKQQSSPS